MISLNAFMIEIGATNNLVCALEELGVSGSEINFIQSQIAVLVATALVRAGHSVIEDFQ